MAEYTKNWTGRHCGHWLKHLGCYRDRATRLLEVGIFEARSACWFLDNILCHPESRYFGIDNWNLEAMRPSAYPRDERGEQMIRDVERRAKANLARYGEKVVLLQGNSHQVLPTIVLPLASVDVAYIDGCHDYPDVKGDTERVWSLVKPGGIVFWDDYNMRRFRTLEGVHRAVAEFLEPRAGQYEVLWESQQLGIRKIG